MDIQSGRNNDSGKFVFKAEESAIDGEVLQSVDSLPEGSENRKKTSITSLHVAFAVLLFVLLFHLFLRVGVVNGNSMSDTLADGQIVLVSKLSKIEAGDIVMTTANNATGRRLIKRVIATGGQHLYVRSGSVYVDGELIDETYVLEAEWGESIEFNILLPNNSVFLMGDNRNHSEDSRTLGLFSTKEVVGELLFVD